MERRASIAAGRNFSGRSRAQQSESQLLRSSSISPSVKMDIDVSTGIKPLADIKSGGRVLKFTSLIGPASVTGNGVQWTKYPESPVCPRRP